MITNCEKCEKIRKYIEVLEFGAIVIDNEEVADATRIIARKLKELLS